MKPAHAQRIVADLLCNPVSMRSAEHFATVLALSTPSAASMMDDAALTAAGIPCKRKARK